MSFTLDNMSDYDILKDLYEKVKAIQGKDAYTNDQVFRNLASAMCKQFNKIFNDSMGEGGALINPLTHQMYTSVFYLVHMNSEEKFAKSLAIFDIYLHQVHRYLETQKFETVTIHVNYHNEPIKIRVYEWDTVDKRWMPTLDYIDQKIEIYKKYEREATELKVRQTMSDLITKYENRKKRLLNQI